MYWNWFGQHGVSARPHTTWAHTAPALSLAAVFKWEGEGAVMTDEEGGGAAPQLK